MTKIGITGSQGFIAKHLALRLTQDETCKVVTLARDDWQSPLALQQFVRSCDVVVHLAAVNRGEETELETVNAYLAKQLTEACHGTDATPHLIYTSTTQREADNAYGRGKRQAEETLTTWAEETGAPLTTLVIPNVFGAGCKPFYNSVVATFCHLLAHGEQADIHEDRQVEFIWVGDLVEKIFQLSQETSPGKPVVKRIAGEEPMLITELLATLEGFRHDYFERDVVPDLTSPLRTKLYSTFLSYIELEDHRHQPPLHTDERGALCEVIKTAAGGQVFFSTTKPGVIRGNHYHTRKIEWFCVVKGEAAIRLRHIERNEIKEFRVSGDKPEFISIPVLYTHSIENVGETELLTMFWCNEIFDATDADTHFEKVA